MASVNFRLTEGHVLEKHYKHHHIKMILPKPTHVCETK